jgi:beta-glucosidase
VQHWTTLNEPWVMALIGYQSGMLAPGIRNDTQGALQTAHHLLLAHGDAIASMRAKDPEAQLGITYSVQPIYPASDSPEDVAAARKIDLEANRLFFEPVLLGHYPDDYRPTLESRADLSFIQDGDEARMGQPIDFIGVNYYHGNVIGAADPGTAGATFVDSLDSPTAYIVADEVKVVSRGFPRTAMTWEIDPQGLYDIMWELSQYPGCPPLYVTENGIALPEDGTGPTPVDDPERVEYLRTHAGVVHEAIRDGIDVRGYYVWTFIDCYEWSDGYTRKFGLYHLDEETLDRTPKTSARWYGGLTRANAL